MSKNYIYQIKHILQSSGLTQRELAGRLGVTFAALNRWLRGHARPHPRRLLAIGKLYRELVVYPARDESSVSQAVRRANRFCRPGLWSWIARHDGIQEELLLEHTYNSTTIEGTTFTKRQAEAVIFHQKMIPDKSFREHLEVTNHASVLRRILEGEGEYHRPISEALIQKLHLGLLQGIRPDAGHYSKHPRALRGVDLALTHPQDIPEEMRGLIRRWRRHKKMTLREIGIFHVQFELIHPFGDGNGRVGRLVLAIQCLQKDFPPIVIENERKAEYYDVLEYAQRKSEGPFLVFLADELARTARILAKYKFFKSKSGL